MVNEQEMLKNFEYIIKKELSLHRQQQPRPHAWLKRFVKDFETNPRTQYKVHLYGMWYWAINFPVIAILFFFFPSVWVGVGLLLNTFYSLYANFATDYGSMSAAIAAFGVAAPPEIPLQQTPLIVAPIDDSVSSPE